MYDGRVGRWMTIDPYEEFWSPYTAMGNDPINLSDPNGGCTDPPCYTAQSDVTPVVTASPLPKGYSEHAAHLEQFNFRNLDLKNGQVLPSMNILEQIGYSIFVSDLRTDIVNGIEYLVDSDGFITTERRDKVINLSPPIGGKVSPGGAAQASAFSFKWIAKNTTRKGPSKVLHLDFNPKIKASEFYQLMNPSWEKAKFPSGFTSENGIKWQFYGGGRTNPNGFTIKGQTPDSKYIMLRFNEF